MALFDRLTGTIAKRAADRVITDLGRIQKADAQRLVTPTAKPGVLRYTFDPVYINSNYYNKKKPDSAISFDVLRNFSLKYEIARACINLRRRQLSGMDWDIVTAETSDTNDYSADIERVKAFISQLGGTPLPNGDMRGGSFRKWMNMVIEDLLCLDAVSLYRQRNRGGDLLTLIPVDGATIRLMISDDGNAPLPPEIAYKQVIRGVVTGDFTTDDMIYDMMNPRTNSPYGLSPLESLMITVSAALKAGLYNLGYLTDGNIPEGLVEAPANWTATQIREFEANWNAAIAGDPSAISKLRWLPAGSKYEPTKKPADMAFADMADWLMRLTCTVYDVNPMELGFMPKHGGAMGHSGEAKQQADGGEVKGLMPVAQMLMELLDEIIQVDLNCPHLRFAFPSLETEDEASKVDTATKLITSGQRTINELRTDDGLDPIDGGDALFVLGQAMPLNAAAAIYLSGTPGQTPEQDAQDKKDQQAAQADHLRQLTEGKKGGGADAEAEARSEAADKSGKKKPGFEDSHDPADADMSASAKSEMTFVQLVTEMRTLRKFTKHAFERGRAPRPFESDVLPAAALAELNDRIGKAATFEEADAVISEYRSDYQVDFLNNVNQLRAGLKEIIGNEQSEPVAAGTR